MKLGSIRGKAVRFASRSEFIWRYLENFPSVAAYRSARPRLSGAARAVCEDLARDGIAIVAAKDLLGAKSLLEPLEHVVTRLEAQSTLLLSEARRAYASGGAEAKKPYSLVLEGKDAPAPGIYTSFALQRAVLDVANGYFGAFSVLTQCQVWHNLITLGAPSQSQLWHRDPEDRHILKMFLYLTDVDEGAGALSYARGSHRRPNEMAPHARLDGDTPRSTDAEMAKLIPPSRWITACGGRGTIVFADTRGYHKGGFGLRSERIVYVCQFLCGATVGIPTRGYHLGSLPLPVVPIGQKGAAAIRIGTA